MSRLSYQDPVRLKWHEWNPGLDNGHLSLGAVMDTMRDSGSAEPEAIPRIIWLLENPASPVHLPGAINLLRHDAVHILVGRGMRVQDEAFVIGFTMGSDPKLRDWHLSVFKWASVNLYPGPYKFSNEDLVSFELGVREAIRQGTQSLAEVPFEERMTESLDALRADLSINRARLYAAYRLERILIPASRASWRLDYCRRTDPSATLAPAGPPSGWKKIKFKQRHTTAHAAASSSSSNSGNTNHDR